MRRHRHIGAITLIVAAAHSRAVAPGDIVDFDEVVRPSQGLPYSLETALGPDAAQFEPAPDEPVGEPVADSGSTSLLESVDEAKSTGRSSRRR